MDIVNTDELLCESEPDDVSDITDDVYSVYQPPNWEKIDDEACEIVSQEIDRTLALDAKDEVTRACKRIALCLGDTKRRNLKEIQVKDILPMWLTAEFIDLMTIQCDENALPHERITRHDILLFILAEMYISFYLTSPTDFFDENNSDVYPVVDRSFDLL